MIEDEGKYYLYRHIRLDTNEVFYIGIGKKKENHCLTLNSEYYRAYYRFGRSNIWYKIISKSDYKVEIVLESDDHDFIQQKEKEFITLYGRKDLNTGSLCNLTDGGLGIKKFKMPSHVVISNSERNKNKKMSQETKDKISKANKGRVCSEETRRKMSEVNLGKHLSEETKEKLRNFNLGKALSSETKQKISDSNKGKIMSKEAREKLSLALRGKVKSSEHVKKCIEGRKTKTFINHYLQYDLQGNLVFIYKTKQELISYGFNYQSVISCCVGRRKTHKGFKWEKQRINKKSKI